MTKFTAILNDYPTNTKAVITFDKSEVTKMKGIWNTVDERLLTLHELPSFRGYDKWRDLTPEHFRLLITRALNTVSSLTQSERTEVDRHEVSTCNFLILAFIICIEQRTSSHIEHFRINRFDDLNVTFDYSATFEIDYNKPEPKVVDPGFSIIVNNINEE